jgi:GNAT superfamily N-acetyltransferase
VPNLTITSEPYATESDIEVVEDAVNQFNVVVTGDTSYSPVRLFLRDEHGRVLGGLLGDIWGGWMHIGFLWVHESWRGQGHGTQLLQAGEAEARAHGCRAVKLDTFSFQARPFYERHGYEVFAELPGFPEGHTFYYLRKMLASNER